MTLGPDPADPSKTTTVPYNAVNSMGSNAGPSNAALIDRVRQDVERLKAENPSQPVPIDLVTSTGSGLDPHISPTRPCSRCRASQRLGGYRKISSARLSANIPSRDCWAFWVSLGSMSSHSIAHWTERNK